MMMRIGPTGLFLKPSWISSSKRLLFLQSSRQAKEKKLPPWEEELQALYGPKLSKRQVKKVISSTNKQYASKNLYDEIRENNEKAEKVNRKNLPQRTQEKSKEFTELETVVYTEVDTPTDPMHNVRSDAKSLLDKLLMFPMFEPPADAVFQATEFADLPLKDIISGPLNGYVPSVSKVINETMSPEARFFLERWEREMIEKLGEEGFKQYKKETFARGEMLHTCIEQHLSGSPVSPIPDNVEAFWRSLDPVLPQFSDVRFLEQRVSHPHLGYTGYFDCVARYNDTLCLIDWKTSKKQKANIKWTYDNPLQLVAYLGAFNFDPVYKDMDKVENCLLVIAYEDGEPAHAHSMSRKLCEQYWRQWLHRLRSYWRLKI